MANQMKFSGKVTAMTEPLLGEGKKGTWESVTIVVTETEGEYKQSIAIECFNKQSELEKICVGAMCDVLFNVEANEYKGKIYGKNKLWKFDNVEMPERGILITREEQVTSANDNEPPF